MYHYVSICIVTSNYCGNLRGRKKIKMTLKYLTSGNFHLVVILVMSFDKMLK